MDSKFDLNSFNSDRFSDCSQRLAGGEDLIQFGPNSGSGSRAETRLRQFSEPEPGAKYCGDGQSQSDRRKDYVKPGTHAAQV